jgi:predicted dehydrogenase
MSLDLTPEQKEIGKGNFQRVAGELTRRDFMKSMALTGAVVAPVSAAAYFQYSRDKAPGRPVRTALIGAGDEGGVLVGEHNPKYVEIVAVSDIRPSNQRRIFEGDANWQQRNSPRKGLNLHYGSDAAKKIMLYENYKDVLARKDIEAVIIALPLCLHAPVAIEALKAGKHVLCEKLMAWNVTQCKDMIKAAQEHDRILSIGHQRHYSLLYAHALEIVRSGVLGDVRHIRALWHRNNARPKLDEKTKQVIPGRYQDGWYPDISDEDRRALEGKIRKYGFKSVEELCRWRLYNRTGGGLMAELGSHQLDACSIFLGKVHPLAVSGVGGKLFYKDDREVDDHVFVTFEFPGPNYFASPDSQQVNDHNDRVIVTYSSISTNAFEPYGECVMGSRGTLVVETEQNVLLYPDQGRNVSVTVTTTPGGRPALDSSASTGAAAPAAAAAAGVAGPISRGYREEMEHFAYCVRMWDQGMSKSDRPQVRCGGKAAMADAIIALTSNLAMKHQRRIEFQPQWFDPASPEVPDAEMKAEVITA